MWSRLKAVVPGQAVHPAALVVIYDCNTLAMGRAATPISSSKAQA